jgi:hypothetical protein
VIILTIIRNMFSGSLEEMTLKPNRPTDGGTGTWRDDNTGKKKVKFLLSIP